MEISTSMRKRCQTEEAIKFTEIDSKKSIINEDKSERKSRLSSSDQSFSDKNKYFIDFLFWQKKVGAINYIVYIEFWRFYRIDWLNFDYEYKEKL